MFTQERLDVYSECMLLEAQITFKPRFMGMDEAQEIKKELSELKKMCDMTDEDLYRNRNKVWKFCLHLLQFDLDMSLVSGFVAVVLMPPIGVVSILINRLLRFAADTVEIKNELNNIDKLISSLNSKKSTASASEKKRIENAIQRLEKIKQKHQ